MFAQCSYNVRTMAKSSYNIVRTLVVDCTNIVRTFLAIVRTLYEHCTNIVRTWYEHCTDYALYKHWPKYCTNIVWMNHRPAIYHPNSAENIKLSIPIAYNVLSEFQSLEYASARFSFLCGLCLTEKNRTKRTLSNVTNQAFACPAMHVSLRHVSLSMVFVCTLL